MTATGGSSGNVITFTTNSVCTVSGSTVRFIKVGKCVIDASQAGDAEYLAAPQVQQTISIGKAPQTITFTSSAPSSATVGSTYAVTATGGSSGNVIIFTTNSVCTVSGAKVHFISVGRCVIEANQAGDTDYLAAIEAQQTIAVGKGSQTITFTSKPPSDAAVGATYTVTASGGASGQPVTFSTTSMCTVSGAKVHFISVGRCVIEANQAGDTDYLAARAGLPELQGSKGHLQDRSSLVSGQSDLREGTDRAFLGHSCSAVRRLGSNREAHHPQRGHCSVHDLAVGGQGNVQAVTERA